MSAKKIVVGLSGGVDSSVSLILLKKQGWYPVGVTFKLPHWQENKKQKINQIDLVQKVCQKLNVPYYQVDVSQDFRKEVVNYFIKELKDYKTPNPCVICNYKLKFAKLFEFAKKSGIDYVATGHYARVRAIRNSQFAISNFQLLMGKDKIKDQSYYLSFLPRKWLSRIIFPLGEYTKEEVYKIAKKEGFDYWQKEDQSQDFCYLGGHSVNEFIRKEIKTKLGEIVDKQGKVLGKHKGLQFYTLGQRQGIGLGGGPYFVKSFDTRKNHLIVTKNKKEIFQKEIWLSPFNFINDEIIDKSMKVMAKVRYRQDLKEAILKKIGDKLNIIFIEPILAPTPGQFCVFWQGDVCLGAGVIN